MPHVGGIDLPAKSHSFKAFSCAEMGTRKNHATVIAAACVVVVLIAAYVAGFFFLGERSWVMGGHFMTKDEVRAFPAKWLVELYRPAVAVESFVTGVEIHPVYWSWPSESDEVDE